MPDPTELAANLLLADIGHFEATLRANEEVGEKRFSFLVSLITAVGGGLAALAVHDVEVGGNTVLFFAQHAAQFAGIAVIAIGVLAVLTWLTYLRMWQRHRSATELKDTLRSLRARYVAVCAPALQGEYPAPPASATGLRRLGRGGYIETTGLLLVMLAAAFVWVAPAMPAWAWIVCGVTVAAGLAVPATR